MGNESERFSVLRVTETSRSNIDELVAVEFPVTLILNNQELVTLLCSPQNIDYLAIGFLYSEGLLKSKDDIKNIIVDDQRGVVRLETAEGKEISQDTLFKRLITSGCGKGTSFYSPADVTSQKIDSPITISAADIFALTKQFQGQSEVYATTHGVHSAALCDNKGILAFSEDIGRHNALDKIFGQCLLQNIPTKDRLIITSGRVSSEMVHKVAKRSIPILISISAPTNLGVRLADELKITLIGFARGRRMNVYTQGWRVITDGKS
jgi:FdhD protein